MKTYAEIKEGDTISFNAARLFNSNPVSGEVVSQSDEWIDIKLHKDIQGLANIWTTGEIKSFRKSLITLI